MTITVKRWFLSLLVLITVVVVVSYLVVTVGMRSAGVKNQQGGWLLIAPMLVASISVTHIIWNRLNRCSRKQLESTDSDVEGLMVPQEEGFEPVLNQSLLSTRDKVEALAGERKELEIQNRLVENRHHHLEAALLSIPEAVIITNSAERVVLANSPAEKMFGFSLAADGHKPLPECIRDEEFLRLLRQVQQSVSHKVAEYSKSNERGERWYDVILSAVTNGKKDESNGVVAICHEVTKQREAARMKTDFVSNVSHELRTPLASIKAYLEMLIDGEAEDEQTRQKFYEVIQDEANRLSNLVDNILNISRIEAGVVKVSKQPVALAAVIKEVLEVAGGQAEASGIKLIDELTPVFFHVRADKEMIRQAVFNLVSNALKYTPEGGTVTVRLTVDEASGQVTTEVADTGVGLSPEDLTRVFEKFYRVSGSTKMSKGTGLGLVLVKEIIETIHGGRLSVSSTLGEGSTFSFSLPLAE